MDSEMLYPDPFGYSLTTLSVMRTGQQGGQVTNSTWQSDIAGLNSCVNTTETRQQSKILPTQNYFSNIGELAEYNGIGPPPEFNFEDHYKQPWNSLNKPSQQSEEPVNMASDTESISALFDGPRVSRSMSMSSSSDTVQRTVRSDSVDSGFTSLNMESSPSLNDVFDSLVAVEKLVDQPIEKPDPFGLGLKEISPARFPLSALITDEPLVPAGVPEPCTQESPQPAATHPADALIQTSNCFSEFPCTQSSNYSYGLFTSLNKGMATALKNPSRGLITVMRRLCDFLSNPRSDRLEAVFVCLLNKTLADMQKAARPQMKRRAKRKSETPTDSTRHVQKAGINRPVFNFRNSCPAVIPMRPRLSSASSSTCSSVVDLTDLEERGNEADLAQRTHLHPGYRQQPFIALEDTIPDFMNCFFT